MTIKQIKEWIKDASNIYITGHIHPDGDCVGAAFGLKSLLQEHGYSSIVLLEYAPEVYSFLKGYEQIMTTNPEGDVDVLFVVDCNSPQRFAPFMQTYRKAKLVINIDHHEHPAEFITEYRRIEPEMSSTSEMIYEMFEGMPIPKEAAEALYMGIIFDTGGFMHSNTAPSTMRAAADLIATGIDFGWIMKRLFYRQSYEKFVAKRIALQNLGFLGDKKIVYTYIPHEEFARNQLKKEDTEDIVHLLAQLEGTEAAVFVAGFEPDRFKLSFRSKQDLDVCEVAKAFGGGGHKKAAGATAEIPLENLLPKIEQEIMSRL